MLKPDEISFGVLFFWHKLRQFRTFLKLLPICNQKEEMWILCSANTTRPFEKYLSNCKDRSELEAHPGEQTQGNMDEVVDMDISDSEVFVIMLIFHCLTILNIVMNIFLHSLNLKFQEEGGPDQVEDMDISDSEVVVNHAHLLLSDHLQHCNEYISSFFKTSIFRRRAV